MKKLLLLFLVIPFLFAASPLQQKHLAVIAALNSGETVANCPVYYADTNVTFSWDGDETSGTNYGCNSSGTPIEGTFSGTPLEIHTDYGESGSNGANIDTNGEYLSWPNSSYIVAKNSSGTIWMRVWVSAQPDNKVTIFESYYVNDDNSILMNVESTSSSTWGAYRGNNANYTAYANTTPTGEWMNFHYSWNTLADADDHSCGKNGTWEDDDGELTNELTNEPTVLLIGQNVEAAFAGGIPGSGKYIYVDRIAVMSGYKTGVPTNW